MQVVGYRTNGLFVINVTLRVRVLTKLPVRPIIVCKCIRFALFFVQIDKPQKTAC